MKDDTMVCYVELDSIMDTRLGTLIRYKPEIVDQLLMSGDYFNRLIDSYPEVNKDQFYDWYANRDKSVLALSTISEMIYLIKEFISRMMKGMIGTPDNRRAVVEINTWPYELDKEEVQLILATTSIWFNHQIEIRHTCRSREELTPAFCKKTYYAMWMYDYWNWFKTHDNPENGTFGNTLLPDVSLFIPAINTDHVPTKQEIAESLRIGHGTDPFDQIAELSAPVINMVFVPVKVWCILTPERLAESIHQSSKAYDDICAGKYDVQEDINFLDPTDPIRSSPSGFPQ